MLKNILFKIISFCFFLVILYHMWGVFHIHTYQSDFTPYMNASKNALDGKDIYMKNIVGHFLYPPSALIVFIPFIFLSPIVAARIWYILSFLLFLLSYYLFIQMFLKYVSGPIKKLICVYFLFSWPFLFTLDLGQVNILILFILVFSFYLTETHKKFFSKRGKEILAGILIGFAGGIKILPLFLVLYYIARKKWLTVVSIGLSFCFFNLLILFFFSIRFENVSIYIKQIFVLLAPTNGDSILQSTNLTYDQSLSSFLFFNLASGRTARISIVFITTLLATLAIIKKWFVDSRNSKLNQIENNWELYSFLIAIPTLFIANLAWEHRLVFLFPILWITIKKFIDKISISSFIILGGIFLCINLDFSGILFLLETTHIHTIIYPVIRYHGLVGFTLLLIWYLRDYHFPAKRSVIH